MANNRRTPILERLYRGRGQEIRPLKVNGKDFPMHTDYLFEKQKVYTKEPKRGLTGAIDSFPEKFFVPYFTVTYAVLPMQEYSEMMRTLSVDEILVEYYDTWENKYETAKFYAQKPEMTKMQPMVFADYDDYGNYVGDVVEYGFIQNTTIVFAGTLGEVSKKTINFMPNAVDALGSAPPRIEGYVGEEFEMPNAGTLSRQGYSFVGWTDSNNNTYTPSGVYAFGAVPDTLFAKWVQNSNYEITLAYGFENVDVNNEDENGNVPQKVNATLNSAINGLPTSVDVLTRNASTNKMEVFRDNKGNKVYNFNEQAGGWYTLPNGKGTKKTNGDTYTVQGNSTLYAHFLVSSYTLTFYKEERYIGGSTWATINGEYGSSFSVPQPVKDGYKFLGWYTKDSDGKESRFSATRIPAGDYNIYAKWQEE